MIMDYMFKAAPAHLGRAMHTLLSQRTGTREVTPKIYTISLRSQSRPGPDCITGIVKAQSSQSASRSLWLWLLMSRHRIHLTSCRSPPCL